MPASSNSPIAKEEFCEGTVRVLALFKTDDTTAEYIQDRFERERPKSRTGAGRSLRVLPRRGSTHTLPYDVSDAPALELEIGGFKDPCRRELDSISRSPPLERRARRRRGSRQCFQAASPMATLIWQ